MNIDKIIRKFKKLGFEIEYGDGSVAKLYPPDKTKPFYSLHIGEKAIHPLRRLLRVIGILILGIFKRTKLCR